MSGQDVSLVLGAVAGLITAIGGVLYGRSKSQKSDTQILEDSQLEIIKNMVETIQKENDEDKDFRKKYQVLIPVLEEKTIRNEKEIERLRDNQITIFDRLDKLKG